MQKYFLRYIPLSLIFSLSLSGFAVAQTSDTQYQQQQPYQQQQQYQQNQQPYQQDQNMMNNTQQNTGGMQCPQGEYPGTNDKGEKTCLRQGTMGSNQNMMEKDQQFQNGTMNQGDQFGQQNQQMGPSEEDMDRMEKQREEEMKKMEKQRIKQMYKGITQGARGMATGIKQMKKMVARMKKEATVPVPEELTEGIASAEKLINYINSFKSADAITDIDAFEEKMSEMQDAGEVLQEWGPRMGDIFRLSGMQKDLARRITQLGKDVTRVKKAVAKSKFELADQIAELDAQVKEIKSAYAELKTVSDLEERQVVIEDIFEQMDDLYEQIRLLDGLRDLKRYKADIAKMVKTNDRDIVSAQKKKFDVEELKSIQAEIKANISELEAALKKKFDAEVIEDLLSTIRDLQDSFQDTSNELFGREPALPQVKVQPAEKVRIDLKAFEGFKKEPEPTNDQITAPNTTGEVQGAKVMDKKTKLNILRDQREAKMRAE
ncbi:MAG TPA: hypothetical protein DCY49_03025 [Candidatus Jacksonbacteria bacterium]|nr:hypothetical protein [Candidatus Jacksonbacteria bacterium]